MDHQSSDRKTAAVDAATAHESVVAAVELPDRWRLVELLGTGGQAAVWLAEWVYGQSLVRIEGREQEGRTILISASERAPGTWIATSVTR